jgi:hypothetical protein
MRALNTLKWIIILFVNMLQGRLLHIRFISTYDQVADEFTKALPYNKTQDYFTKALPYNKLRNFQFNLNLGRLRLRGGEGLDEIKSGSTV